jgi:hypothetical protein
MPVGKGYPRKAGKVKGKTVFRMHKGGRKFNKKQVRMYFATKGFKKKPRAKKRR